MAIDLKQLSARLKLSPTTVSRALNGYPDVSAATRERVVKMARELGYEPNPVARRLARGQADAIGIIYPLDAADLGDPMFLEVLEGLSAHLDEQQTELILVAAHERTELRSYERLVRGGRVDGLVVSRTRVVDPRIEFMLRSPLPFVAHGRTGDCAHFAWVDYDNEAGGALAVQQLLSLGHRSIAYLHAPLHLNFAHQRHAGFRRAMQQAGIAPRAEWVVDAGISRRTGHAAALRLLAARPWPTAVIVDNSLCGVGVLRALLDHEVAVGRTMSVIVYDGVPADSVLAGQRIAAIEQPTAADAGRTMAEMLMALCRRQPLEQRQVLWQPQFVGGNSIGPAP